MEKMLEILASIHPEIDFSSCGALIDDGLLNSFDIITIIGEISDAYGVNVPAEEIIPENFNSAATLYTMVERLLED